MSAALAWGRLLRLSLLPTAVADIAAGILVGSYGDWPPAAAWPLFAASLAVYHGGMVLNDWVDREHDQRTRPERPIPSGAIAADTARTVGFALVLGSVALAALISWRAAAWFAGLASLVLAYDLFGRGAWLGPALLGACRAANLGAGLLMQGVLIDEPFHGRFVPDEPFYFVPSGAWLLAGLYGAFVFCASRVARFEDVADEAEIGQAPRAWLLAAAALLCTPAFVDPYGRPGLGVDPFALVLVLAGAFGLVRTALRTRRWTRAEAGRATSMALRRLLVFTAACAVAGDGGNARGWSLGVLILGGYLVSGLLRKAFPPT